MFNKLIGFGIIIGSSSLMYYLYINPKNKKEKKIKKKEKNSLINLSKNINYENNHDKYYSKVEIIKILNWINDYSNNYIEDFIKEYRTKRRSIFKNIDKYKEINDELNIKLGRIITKFTKIVFEKEKIDQEKFDNSIEKFKKNDEINNILNNLCSIKLYINKNW